MRLKWDDDLAYAAASHLKDMLAYGSVSHRSPMYGNLTSRLERLDIAFEVALENLATAPSLEEAHWHLMLSAEHRRNVLDPRLTHLGIAVTRAAGSGVGGRNLQAKPLTRIRMLFVDVNSNICKLKKPIKLRITRILEDWT